MANVFLSHRTADMDRARRLAEELKACGHDVWFDEWEVSVGDSIVERIDDGLKGSAYLVLCCSAIGSNSPWMSREWMSALARQLDGAGVKVLPVLLSGGELPAILADIRYADLVRDWDGGVSELCRAIR